MGKYYILFNPYSGNGNGGRYAEKLKDILCDDDLIFCDMTKSDGYRDIFLCMSPEDRLIVAGGDGTLNRFINENDIADIKNEIWYYATGSGNDFLHDLGMKKGAAPFRIDGYLDDLPTVSVKGCTYKFFNGFGFGIDGYCSEEGDKVRKRTSKPVNYTPIALKGFIYGYRPVNAKVTVDGVTREYTNVWLAPAMKGRFYGGGMMIAPDQDRLCDSGTVSVVVAHDIGRLRLLTIFPQIFRGTHVRYKKYVDVICGKHISVEFDRPAAGQVDGETVTSINGYEVFAGKKEVCLDEKRKLC